MNDQQLPSVFELVEMLKRIDPTKLAQEEVAELNKILSSFSADLAKAVDEKKIEALQAELKK